MSDDELDCLPPGEHMALLGTQASDRALMKYRRLPPSAATRPLGRIAARVRERGPTLFECSMVQRCGESLFLALRYSLPYASKLMTHPTLPQVRARQSHVSRCPPALVFTPSAVGCPALFPGCYRARSDTYARSALR
jgi:hypothetical protein